MTKILRAALGLALLAARWERASITTIRRRVGKQNWVDSTGGIVRYTGGLVEEGVMKMEGANTTVNGVTKRARVTWTRLEDGRVHHLIEHSKHDGKTWTPAFDAIYARRKEEAEEGKWDPPLVIPSVVSRGREREGARRVTS